MYSVSIKGWLMFCKGMTAWVLNIIGMIEWTRSVQGKLNFLLHTSIRNDCSTVRKKGRMVAFWPLGVAEMREMQS
jgi:hypothetical protein